MKISRCVGLVENPWTIQLSFDELLTLTRALMIASVISIIISSLSAAISGLNFYYDLIIIYYQS